MKWSRLILQV